jgi:16S rRNA (guanine966-N2)-methyltransferase
MRIVAGKFAGRDLVSPSDARVRPTAEPVRDYLLTHLAPELAGARVLDLFAGSGGLGLEAISRGSRSADFVEIRPASLHALKANVAALRLRERTRIFKKDAIVFAAALGADSYDIAFADPPYGSSLVDRVLEIWRERRFAGILAVESERSHPLPPGKHRKTFEDTAVTVYRR